MAPSVLRINLFYAVPVAIVMLATLAWQVVAQTHPQPEAVAPVALDMATSTEIATTTIATTTATSTLVATSTASAITAPSPKSAASAPKSKTSTKSSVAAPVRTIRNLTHLTVPTGLIARHITDNEIMISWKPSTGDKGVAGYTIFQDSEEIGATSKNTFAAIHLAASTTYKFAVEAYDVGGNTSSQATLSVQTTAYVPPPVEPVAPPPPAPVYGVCGAADGAAYAQAPSAGLCSTGIPDTVVINGNSWLWSCVGAHGGTTAACRAIADASQADTASSGNTSTTGSTGSTGSTGGSTAGTSHTPKNVTITVNQSGVFGASSAALFVGDTIIFQYNGTGDEVVVSFNPAPPSSMKLDHEFTSKSYKFTSVGTWTYSAQGHSGTITVSP